ncbi:MAG: sugar phosphate permease [Blastococcus sp.]|nr:sugar phosphate permease [Blastococcus sp.]
MAATQSIERRRVFSAGAASVLGWSMDLYDLMIILYVAATIGPLLIPAESATLQLAFVYASFAVTLVMRPLGSAVFGNFADKNGRKKAMLVAITGVGVSTALMGAVPTYATAGVAAPLLFVALRLVQGVFVGGVVASTHTLGTETAGPRHRGLMSGVVAGGGAGTGAVMASLVFLIVSTVFPGDAFSSVGWRFMFFTGLIAAGLSFFVYARTEESPLWKAQDRTVKAPASPIKSLFSARYLPVFLMNLILVIGGASLYYLTVGFFPTFLGTNIGLERGSTAVVLILANLAVVVGGVVGGLCSDRIGRRRTFVLVGVPTLIGIPLLYTVLSNLTPDDVALISVVAVSMAFLMMTATAPILIFLNERFPTRIRATGTAMSWNVGYAVGGMTPTLVTLLSPEVGDLPSRLVIVTAVAAGLFLLGAAVMPDTKEIGLDRVEDVDPATMATAPSAHSADDAHTAVPAGRA